MAQSSGIFASLLVDQDGVFTVRYDTPKGAVVVAIKELGPGVAELSVYELEAAIHGSASLEGLCARNRFGTGLILRILRSVKAATPNIRQWVFDRNGGANPTRPRRAMEV